MMTPVCRTNDQWTAKFRLASDPTKYASQPYVIFAQRVELWAERLHFRRLSAVTPAHKSRLPIVETIKRRVHSRMRPAGPSAAKPALTMSIDSPRPSMMLRRRRLFDPSSVNR